MAEQNEKKQNNSGFTELSEEEINNSSIFSKPNIEQKKAPRENNRIALKTAVALLLAAILIFGVLFLNARFGKKASSSAATSSVVESTASEKASGIKVTENTAEDVKAIKLTNKNGEFNFYPTVSDETGEETIVWYLKEIENWLTETDYTSLTVGDCAAFTALVKQPEKAGTDYGFASPSATAEVTLKSGEKYTITIGNKFENSGMSGAYAKISTDSENVYILNSDNYDYFTKDYVYYILKKAPTAVPQTDGNKKYFSDETLETFDYIEISGSAVKQDFRFEPYGRKHSSILYTMTSPQWALVDDAGITDIIAIMKTDLEATDVYCFNVNGLTDKQLKSYGLDKPIATVKYKVGSEETEINIALSETDNYYYSVTVSGVPAIYKIPYESFEFIYGDIYDFATNSVLLEQIASLDDMVITTEEKSYTLDIVTTTKDGEDTVSAKYGKTKINDENLYNYYQYLMAIKPYLSKTSILSKAPDGITKHFEVTLNPAAGGDEPLTMTVYKIKDNSARYYIELDGKPIGLCEKTATDRAYEAIKNLTAGEDIADYE